MPETSTAVLPNLFVIGAAKSGTTSLHSYLDAHRQISMSEPKEPAVFAAANWHEALPRYSEMFADPRAPVRGESSTRYSVHPVVQGIPERIASRCPDARLVYVVRDPVERVVANWVEGYASLREHGTLARALKDLDQPGNRYVAASRYATQLREWLRFFDRDQVLVVDQARLRDEREAALLEVLGFLDVAPEVPAGTATEHNRGEEKALMTPAAARLWFTLQPLTRRLPPRAGRALQRSPLFPVEKIGRPALDERLRRALEDELRPEAEAFRELTGIAFPSWSL
jgi:Sulfotransferase domain